MSGDASSRLRDALLASHAILDFTKGLSFADYEQSLLVRSAVERQIEIIGEAMRLVRQADSGIESTLPEIAQMIGIRNRLIHGYAHVDDEIVWDVVATKIPALIAVLEHLLVDEAK